MCRVLCLLPCDILTRNIGFFGTALGNTESLVDGLQFLFMAHIDQDPRIDQLSISSSTKIGRYSFSEHSKEGGGVEPLGVGGSGIVYTAFQELDCKTNSYARRAIKFFLLREDLRRGDDDESSFRPATDNFLEEIANISDISHENLIQVTDAGHYVLSRNGREHSVPYIVSHLIDGCTLRDLLDSSPRAKFVSDQLKQNPELAVTLVSQIARGLDYLHSRNLLHCDIAPKNIFIERGPTLRAVVGDVGMARSTQPTVQSGIFVAGTRSYTPQDIVDRFETEVSIDELRNWFPYWDLFALSKTAVELLGCTRDLVEAPWLDAALVKAQEAHKDARNIDSSTEFSNAIEYCLPALRERGNVPELEPKSVGSRKRMMPINALLLTSRVDHLIRHPGVTRLLEVPQLTIVSTPSPGGAHTRYEHALGVMENTRQMLSALLDEPSFLSLFTRESVETGLLAGLLYNAHRFPFSNIVHELNQRSPTNKEKPFLRFGRSDLLDDVFGEQFRSHERLTLEEHIARDFPLVDFPKLRSVLEVKESGNLLSADEQVLHALLNSSVDARVLDFVRRDSLHLGLSSGDFFDLDDLLPHVAIALISSGTTSRYATTLKIQGVSVVEQIILMRYWLYQRVYWNVPNRAYVAAIRRGLLDLCAIPDFEKSFRDLALCSSEKDLMKFFVKFAKSNKLESTEKLLETVTGNEKVLYKRAFERNLSDAQNDAAKSDAEIMKSILTRADYSTLRQCEIELGNLASNHSGMRSNALRDSSPLVLLDVPFEPGNPKLGGDIFIAESPEIQGTTQETRVLQSVSPIVAGVQKSFEENLTRLRIFVRRDVADDEIGEKLYEELRRLVERN